MTGLDYVNVTGSKVLCPIVVGQQCIAPAGRCLHAWSGSWTHTRVFGQRGRDPNRWFTAVTRRGRSCNVWGRA